MTVLDKPAALWAEIVGRMMSEWGSVIIAGKMTPVAFAMAGRVMWSIV